MNQVLARPIRPFEWEGSIKTPKKSKAFFLNRRQFKELQANGLVVEAEVPSKPAGTPPPASPAGQASPSRTAKRSGSGATKRRKRGQSSASTQRSD